MTQFATEFRGYDRAEVDTFVLRRDAQMSSRWEPTLSLSAVVALGLAM